MCCILVYLNSWKSVQFEHKIISSLVLLCDINDFVMPIVYNI